MPIYRPQLEILPVFDAFQIREELINGRWVEDPELTKELIKKLLTKFISIATVNNNGEKPETVKAFQEAAHLIRFFLEPLESQGYLAITSDCKDLPTLFIHPNLPQISDIIRIGNTREHTEWNEWVSVSRDRKIPIDKTFLYTHIDTVDPVINKIPDHLDCYFDPSLETVYGLGTNDMKAQVIIATIMLAYFRAFKGRTYDYVVVVSPNEEYKIRKDEDYLALINSMVISKDLEPTADNPNAMVESIRESQKYGFSFHVSESRYSLKQEELYTRIRDVLTEHNYIFEDVDLHITRTNSGIIVSLACEGIEIPECEEIVIKTLIGKILKEVLGISDFGFEPYVPYDGFYSRISKDKKLVLDTLSNKYKSQNNNLTNRHLTKVKTWNNRTNLGQAMHNMGTSFTKHKLNQTIVHSISEAGPRHTAFEAGRLPEMVNLLHMLSEIPEAMNFCEQ